MAPVCFDSGKPGVAGLIYGFFSTICHQIDSRSFHVSGQALAVCARCLGIYSGLLVALLLLPLTKYFPRPPLPRKEFLILFSLPMAADFTAGLLRLFSSSNSLRFITGLVWGGIIMPYFLAAINETALFLRAKMARPGRRNGRQDGQLTDS